MGGFIFGGSGGTRTTETVVIMRRCVQEKDGVMVLSAYLYGGDEKFRVTSIMK